MKSLIIATVGIVLLMIFWVLIQYFWRHTFKEYVQDDDVLAQRKSCSNCGCTTICQQKENV